uniref:Transposase (Putative), gypsy type n=1 Tax=Tanacetum cinerariifolium TaxID=118510 RepID=A0A6L2M8E2_TANCI|nr:hypothetical protein [Tanacetum cinerariifolium]
MGSIDSLKYVLTQSAVDNLCEKYYISDAVHPELPGPNSRIRRSRTDPPPAPEEFSMVVCDFLADNPASFKKFSKAFMCLVGISRYYTLDENSYPTFWEDEDEGGEGEVLLLELTKDRVVSLAGVHDQGDVAAPVVGSSDDDVNEGKLRADHGTSGDASATTVRKSLTVMQDLFDKSTLAAKVGDTTAATVPLVTSSIAPIPECEVYCFELYYLIPAILTTAVATTVVTGTSIPQHGNVNEATQAGIFADSTSTGNVNPDAAGPSQPSGNDISSESFYVSLDIDSEALRQAYVPRWDVLNDSLLDDSNVCCNVDDQLAPPVFFSQLRAMEYDQLLSEFNVRAARQTYLSAEVRMHLEHLIGRKKRLEDRCGMQEKLLTERDLEMADLKARISLKEDEEVARACELGSLKEQSVALVSAATAKDAKIEEIQNAQVKVLSDRVAIMDSDLMVLNLHMDEDFYPHFLKTLVGLRWIISRGAILLVMKCLHSPEYMTALGGDIGCAIEKAMQDGLAAGIDHGQAGRVLADVSAYDPSVEANYLVAINDLRSVDFSLLAQL